MQKGSVNKVVLVGHLGGDTESLISVSVAAVVYFYLSNYEFWS